MCSSDNITPWWDYKPAGKPNANSMSTSASIQTKNETQRRKNTKLRKDSHGNAGTDGLTQLHGWLPWWHHVSQKQQQNHQTPQRRLPIPLIPSPLIV